MANDFEKENIFVNQQHNSSNWFPVVTILIVAYM